MMARCIALARASVRQGELPFAALVCQNGVVVAEATNRVAQDGDVTHHAELLAVSEAQRRLQSKRLKGCTLYSGVEPCGMCAFPIRETGISRVVFAIQSPVMGGFTRWNVLGDPLLARTMPVFFSQPPEVVSGLLAYDAEAAWRAWNPVLWALIKMRGCIVAGGNESRSRLLRPRCKRKQPERSRESGGPGLRECGFDHSILGEALLTPRLSQPSSEVLSLKRAASPRQRFLAGLGIALAIGNPRPSQRNRCVAERSSLAQILLGLENGLGGRLMALQRTTA